VKYEYWFANVKGINSNRKLEIRKEFPNLEMLYNIEETALNKHNIEENEYKIILDSNDETSTSYTKKYLLKNSNNELFFNVNIERTIESEEIEGFTYGYEKDGKYYIISSNKDSFNGTKSYDGAMIYAENYKEARDNSTLESTGDDILNYCKESEGCYTIETTANQIDIMLYKTLYWPAVYEVEYKVCPVASSPTPSKSWTLTYDRGVTGEEVNKVQKMPSPNPQPGITNSSVYVSTTKPEREGYEFSKWCTEMDGKGTCVESGKVFENKDMTDKKLYAYWVKPGTENNEKQGVMSYVLGFAGVGIIAYGLYYVINKKNLFKQI